MKDRHTVFIFHNYRLVVGSYSVEDGMVTVGSGEVRKSTQVGGSPPKVLAKLMLRELDDEGLAK
jgi:hypothetical protein